MRGLFDRKCRWDIAKCCDFDYNVHTSPRKSPGIGGVDGKTLTEMIAEKDALNAKINLYRNLIDAASNVAHRATRTEIKIKSTVDVGKLQKQADAYAKELRLLDNRLQEANWLNELL